MKREYLKPCPFCGHDADIDVHGYPNGEREYYIKIWHDIWCPFSDMPFEPSGTNKRKLIKAWNTREERSD